MRHEDRLKQNQRMSMQVRNLNRLSEGDKTAIREQAEALRQRLQA
jgi:deoxyribodipyrimidine photolyase-related protein